MTIKENIKARSLAGEYLGMLEDDLNELDVSLDAQEHAKIWLRDFLIRVYPLSPAAPEPLSAMSKEEVIRFHLSEIPLGWMKGRWVGDAALKDLDSLLAVNEDVKVWFDQLKRYLAVVRV